MYGRSNCSHNGTSTAFDLGFLSLNFIHDKNCIPNWNADGIRSMPRDHPMPFTRTIRIYSFFVAKDLRTHHVVAVDFRCLRPNIHFNYDNVSMRCHSFGPTHTHTHLNLSREHFFFDFLEWKESPTPNPFSRS